MSSCSCGIAWGGLKTAHCAACHATFSTPNNFDRHRKNFSCQRPEDVGLVQDKRKVWRMPPAPLTVAESLAVSET